MAPRPEAKAKKATTAGPAARPKSAAVRDGSGAPRRYTVGPDVDLDREVVQDSRGRRITSEYVESAAADALNKVGRGRPSLAGNTGTDSPQVTFRLPAKLKAKAERRAQAEGKKVSQVAREALERYLG
jgi:hypothetical protein